MCQEAEVQRLEGLLSWDGLSMSPITGTKPPPPHTHHPSPQKIGFLDLEFTIVQVLGMPSKTQFIHKLVVGVQREEDPC